MSYENINKVSFLYEVILQKKKAIFDCKTLEGEKRVVFFNFFFKTA